MATYKLGISPDKKTVYLALGADAFPGGTIDLGTFDDTPTDDQPLINRVRDVLYKRAEDNPALAGFWPGNITDLAGFALRYHGTNAQTTGIYSTRNEIALVGTGNTTFQVKRQNDDSVITAGLTVVSANTGVATVANAGGTYTVTGVAAGTTQINISSANLPFTLSIPVTVKAA